MMRRYIVLGTLMIVGLTLAAISLVTSGTDQRGQISTVPKIDGVSFEAPHRTIEQRDMVSLLDINASWIAIMPFAFSREKDPQLVFDRPHQWWGERTEGITATVNYAHELRLKVMIKPHVWVRGQGWPGEFDLDSEQQWQQWENNYRAYALRYAKLADSLNAEMFCIGTEFRIAAAERPEFWRSLISEIRSFYHGKLTYAANWDNYQNITFWDELDYIGIDAYFPISGDQTPKPAELVDKWQPVTKDLRAFSGQYGKPILFTEFGYRSIDHAAGGDWNYDIDTLAVNYPAQANAYEALFDTFWQEPWFAGGFLWKWHAFPEDRRRSIEKRFTPQGKPAEKVIRKWYRQKFYANPVN